MRSYEHLLSDEFPGIGYLHEQSRQRKAADIVEDGRSKVRHLQENLSKIRARHIDRRQEYYGVFSQMYQLEHLVESFHSAVEAGGNEPRTIVIDDMQIIEAVLNHPEGDFYLPPQLKSETVGTGIDIARNKFTALLSPHESALLPWGRTAMYLITGQRGELSEEYRGKIDTVLEGVCYEYQYYPGKTEPIRTLVINPFHAET